MPPLCLQNLNASLHTLQSAGEWPSRWLEKPTPFIVRSMCHFDFLDHASQELKQATLEAVMFSASALKQLPLPTRTESRAPSSFFQTIAKPPTSAPPPKMMEPLRVQGETKGTRKQEGNTTMKPTATEPDASSTPMRDHENADLPGALIKDPNLGATNCFQLPDKLQDPGPVQSNEKRKAAAHPLPPSNDNFGTWQG